MKKKYAIIGLSGRSKGFTNNILDTYKDCSEIVALLDSNQARIADFNEANSLNIPGYNENEFDKMVLETKPDAVIISTTDATHHSYIVAAMKHNIDAITEKPMTIDAEKTRAILDAEKSSDAEVQVTFNYRYAPVHTKIKEMIMDGAVGKPTQVDFNYYLDTFHGASYFKRWNRYEKQAGSLLVTKACHHFDLVNWWLGQKPLEVFAYGAMNYYGADGPCNPEKVDGRRCSTCKTKCQYYLRHASGVGTSDDEHLINFNNPGKNEKFGAVDGYYADRCIFDSDIDTWDTFTLTARFDGGTIMSYSLNASVPYEGYRVAINGTEGRIESDAIHGKGMRLPFPEPQNPQNIKYFPMFDGMQTIEVINKGGGHGGGDPIMKDEVFMGKNENDKTKRFAGAWDGALSVLLGTAARESLKSGKPVKIEELLKG
jgi:predicted dehydrogenase